MADNPPLDFFAAQTWEEPTAEELVPQLAAWLAVQPLEPARREALIKECGAALAKPSSQTDRLGILASTFAAASPAVLETVELCSSPHAGGCIPEFAWLYDADNSSLVRNNMRLYYARWLVQGQMYDEALAVSDGLGAQDVVDPASLLFYRAVAYHYLARSAEAEAVADQLLEREWELPERYRQLAGLIQKDNATVEEDSLDHISRRMADIGRRLTMGRAGQRVQFIEKGVIDSIDKLIEELEQQQQQASAQGQPGATPSGTPMDDSRLAELKAPGKVDHRDIGNRSGWGDLPPKQREQALQQIGREFPAHYREVIEQYFIELANESSRGGR